MISKLILVVLLLKMLGTSKITTELHLVLEEVPIHYYLVLGAYGEVRKCQHKTTKALRAVKIINKKCLEEEERKKMLNEVEILKKMVRVTF